MNSTSPPGPWRGYRFVRSRSDRKLGGICGAIARDLDTDPTIVRILVASTALLSGVGIIAYALTWVLAPQAAVGSEEERRRDGRPVIPWDGRQVAGAVLLGLGGILLLDRVGLGLDAAVTIPLLMIVGGVIVLLQRRQHFAVPSGGPTPVPVPGAGPTRGGTAAWTSPTVTTEPTDPTEPSESDDGPSGTGIDSGPTPADLIEGPAPVTTSEPGDPSGTAAFEPLPIDDTGYRADFRRDWDASWQSSPRPWEVPTPGETVEPRAAWPRIAWALLLVGIGAAWLLFAATEVSATAIAASFVVGIGAALVIGGWLGRPKGFAFIGIISALIMFFLSVTDVSWKGEVGDRRIEPTNETLQRTYRQSFGVLRLDLSRLDLRGKRADIDIEVSAGALAIEVPKDVGIVYDGRSGLGAQLGIGGDAGGVSHRKRFTAAERDGAGVIHIRARVGAGAAEIARVGELREITEDKVRVTVCDGDECVDRSPSRPTSPERLGLPAITPTRVSTVPPVATVLR